MSAVVTQKSTWKKHYALYTVWEFYLVGAWLEGEESCNTSKPF